MPTPLKDLERDLARALTAHDPEQASAVRRLIVEQHPDTEQAAEAGFRLGLEALFNRLDLDQAAESLRGATKVKGSRWAQAARVSLGLALFRQGKVQQAVFELRKVAGQKPPTLAGAQALGFVVEIQKKAGPPAEVERSRTELLKMLLQLSKSADQTESSLAHLMLGAEHKHDGRREEARKHLALALERTGLEPDYVDRAKAMLDELS